MDITKRKYDGKEFSIYFSEQKKIIDFTDSTNRFFNSNYCIDIGDDIVKLIQSIKLPDEVKQIILNKLSILNSNVPDIIEYFDNYFFELKKLKHGWLLHIVFSILTNKHIRHQLKLISEKYIEITGEKNVKFQDPIAYVNAINEYYQYIISHMPGNVYWMDKNSRMLGCNKNTLDMIGLQSIDQFIGLSYEEIGIIANWQEGQEQSFKNDDLQVMRTKKPIFNKLEPPLYDNEGNPIFYISNRVPLFNVKNKIIGVVGISINITELKMAEEREKIAIKNATEAHEKAAAEEELRRAVMVLSGSIAHDLRTLITSVRFLGNSLIKFSPILENSYEKAVTAKLVPDEIRNIHKQQIFDTGNTLIKVVNQMNEYINITLKSLSKSLLGQINQQDLVETSIAMCISELIESYPFNPTELKLIFWNREHEFKFLGNPIMTIRIITNLIKNALYQIEKNKCGQIYIFSTFDDNYNYLHIKDTAGGAPKEIIEHMFDGYKTTKEDGTGVGLAFCKYVMKTFNGDIIASSVYGNYMEFILSFPKKIMHYN